MRGFKFRCMFRLIIIISRFSPQEGKRGYRRDYEFWLGLIQISPGHFRQERPRIFLLFCSETPKIPKAIFMFVIRDASPLVNYSVRKFHSKLQVRITSHVPNISTWLSNNTTVLFFFYQYYHTFRLLFKIMFVLPYCKNTETMNLRFLRRKVL